MNRLDLNQTGGVPLSTQILDGMQQAYYTANKFGLLAGDRVIVTGCLESAGTVSDGYVIINGELLFFKGTAASEKVIIVEEAENPRGFEDGSAKPIIYNRYATFGAGDPEFPWSSFRRPLTLFQLEDRLTQLEKTVPIGLVAIWGRPADEIPQGWEEHTDLAGKVPVGHLPSDVNFGALNNSIGVAQVTLDINQIPSHSHDTRLDGSGDDVDSDGYGYAVNTSNREVVPNRLNVVKVQPTGGGQSHTNIQPSRIVKFIRFVGFPTV